MNKKEYHKLLKDNRWIQRRFDFMSSHENKCAVCGSVDKLQLHHKVYDEKAPWEYTDDEMEILCEFCHEKHHREHGSSVKKTIGVFSTKIIRDNSNGISRTAHISNEKIVLHINKTINESDSIAKNISNLIESIYDAALLQKSGNIRFETRSIIGDISCSMNISVYFNNTNLSNIDSASFLILPTEKEYKKQQEFKKLANKAAEYQNKIKISLEKRKATIAAKKLLKEQDSEIPKQE